MNVAFIGLGVMGYAMAGHLSKAGHQVNVYNRTTAKAESWVDEYEGQFSLTPAQAAKGADIVFVCVGNDQDLNQVVCEADGVLEGMVADSVLVDHTTASADIARHISAKAAKLGIGFLDAPVSGGQAGAENGVLSVMVGGDDASFSKASPVMECYSKSISLLGPVGSGQLAKMVNQICIGGLLQSLSEAVHFAKCSGLDAEQVFDVIQHGAAGSWQMVNRHQTMIEGQYDFGFAVDWMRKDFSIVLDEARKNGARLPVTAMVDQFYADVQAMGGGRMDTSSLLKRLENDK